MATYSKAIKVTVDGPREPRSKTSKYKHNFHYLRTILRTYQESKFSKKHATLT